MSQWEELWPGVEYSKKLLLVIISLYPPFRTMKQLVLFGLLLFTGASCAKDSAAPAPAQAKSTPNVIVVDDTQCLDVYDPVCSNGVTYPNACYAHKAGVKTYTKGACGASGEI
jgi:hypothetical protein